LRPLVQQIAEADAATTTRSASLKAQPSSKKEVDASKILPYTPSAGLFIDGMTDEQVWKQLEMRAESLGNVLKVIGVESGEQDDEDAPPAHGDEDNSEEDEEDEDDDDDMSDGEQELLEEMMDQNLSVEEMEEMLAEYRQEKRRRDGEDGEESEEDQDEDEEMDELSNEDELEDDDMEEDELDEEDVDMDDENDEEEGEDDEESDMIDPLFAGRSKQACVACSPLPVHPLRTLLTLSPLNATVTQPSTTSSSPSTLSTG
jgi:U3 small nucleolar RNA-associated protein MPP10